MEFIQIKSSEDTFFDNIQKLYQEAFPENQRHTENDFKKIVESGKDNFYCNAVLLNGSFVGFFNYWIFDKFIFAEHFAIEEAVRGNKIGEKVMKMIKSTSDLPLVFEVEYADTEINARRIEFYRRLGYEIVPLEYLQPAYNKNVSPQPLHIMTDDIPFVMNNYEMIKAAIYKNVYGVK